MSLTGLIVTAAVAVTLALMHTLGSRYDDRKRKK